VKPDEPLRLQPQFSILIGTGGELTLAAAQHEPLQLSRGVAAVLPYGAGMTTLSGEGSAIRALPPVVSPPAEGAR